MTQRQIVLTAACVLSFSGLFNQANGAVVGAKATQALTQRTYPLFRKALFSPQKTSAFVNFLVNSKSTLQTASLIGGGIALLMGIYYKSFTNDKNMHTPADEDWPPSKICWLLALGIPTATYLALELFAIPTIGLSTTIAGE